MNYPALAELPLTREAGCPFDPPADLARIRSEQPLARLTYPDGHVGWLVTSYELARAVLADRRFSSRYELAHYPIPGLGIEELPPAPVGDMTGMDPPEHSSYRRLLTSKSPVRRRRQLTERAEQVTNEHLDAMRRQGPPVDLVDVSAHPVPAVMICELLGVPYADRETFRGYITTMSNPDATPHEQFTGYTALQEYVGDLVRAKRTNPTDEVLGDLATGDLTDEELAGIGTFLLAAGLDTTSNMLALGTFALLRNPAQIAALHTDPAAAVEELLRYLAIAHTGIRAALEDVELAGQLVKAGETVAISIQSANRDPARFANPHTLDVGRKATGHLAFRHRIHQGLGQQLARVEMTAAFPTLFTRFPTMRLAVPPEDV